MKYLSEIALENSRISRLERLLSIDSHHRYSATLMILRKVRYLLLFPFFAIRNYVMRRSCMRTFVSLGGSWSRFEALVLGNGPSLGDLNIEEARLRIESGRMRVVASNNFYQSDVAKTLTPEVYLLRDVYYILNPKDEVWRWLSHTPSVKLAVPYSWKTAIPKEIDRERVFFFEDWVFPLFRRSYSLVGFRSFMGTSGTVALALAAHFKPKRVLFLGLDLTHYMGASETCEGSLRPDATPYAEGVKQDPRPINLSKELGIVDVLQASANQIYLLKRVFHGRPIPFVNLNTNSVFSGFSTVTPKDKSLLRHGGE